MMRFLLGALLVVLAPQSTTAGEEPSWFVGNGLQVCNIIEIHGQEIMLSTFAPEMGKAWAEEHGVTTEYLVLPLIFDQPPSGDVTVECGRRAYKSQAVETQFVRDGQWYALAVFEKRFRLNDVSGFRYKSVELNQESKLR